MHQPYQLLSKRRKNYTHIQWTVKLFSTAPKNKSGWLRYGSWKTSPCCSEAIKKSTMLSTIRKGIQKNIKNLQLSKILKYLHHKILVSSFKNSIINLKNITEGWFDAWGNILYEKITRPFSLAKRWLEDARWQRIIKITKVTAEEKSEHFIVISHNLKINKLSNSSLHSKNYIVFFQKHL